MFFTTRKCCSSWSCIDFDSTVRQNSMNLWSVLYFWVRQALWCKCTPHSLGREVLHYIHLFSFIVCFWINARAWKKPVWTCLNLTKQLSASTWMQMHAVHCCIWNAEHNYKANRNRHCIFSTATRGAIENKRKPASSMTSFCFRSAVVIKQQLYEQKSDSNWIWFMI